MSIFEKCPNIPFDIAVMEKTKLATVFPLDVNWSEVGNWDSLWEISEKDKNGNVLEGNILAEDVKNSYLRSTNRLVVGSDVSDLIVVETFDAVLVTKKGSGQKIKDIVENLKKVNFFRSLFTSINYLIWGDV